MTLSGFTDRIYAYFLRLTRRLSTRQMLMVLAVIVGLLAGVGTFLFELLLHAIEEGLTRWFSVDEAQFLYLIYPVIGIILATLFVRYIVRDNISEGVTRVLYAMSRGNSQIAPHNTWTSVVGGATTIGFGGSVGPEAPIVLTGAAIGSNVGRLARLNYKYSTLLLCCGAGAAVAAIFKAPITGLVFVLEILMLDITATSIIPLLIATVTATTMAFILRGFDPIIAVKLSPEDGFELWQIPLFILLGICCGLM
ncbi:MAG: chloride channel protein, partial [Alistipes sp.]|nr:chloride channel protein [Alistipes sp.]